jgi:hypothetical protein
MRAGAEAKRSETGEFVGERRKVSVDRRSHFGGERGARKKVAKGREIV